ncbi:MAG TPA: hypothetical protein ENO30_05655 [Thermodesulfobium narugense]|nr:hypothetical protein [Thermodesulfobium narugense]
MKNESVTAFQDYTMNQEGNIEVLMNQIGLSERDAESLARLVEFRNRVKPEMPLDQFVLFLTYLAELNFLSEEAYQGFKKFYKTDENIKTVLEDLGRILFNGKDPEKEDEDPLEWMMVEYMSRYYKDKNQQSVTVMVDRDMLSELMNMVTDEEAKAFGIGITEKANSFLRDYYKKIKDKRAREKLRKK